MIEKLKKRYVNLVTNLIPLLLTSICRNPESKFFGCCDRDWWHYKIRDFPSLILQQAGYALSLIRDQELMSAGITPDDRDLIVDGVINFWLKRTKRRGYAEEYYPFEDGYPPLAFGTLAMAKIVYQRKSNFDQKKLELAFASSAKKLMLRFEGQAANQQVAGLAALFYIKLIFPKLICSKNLNDILNKTLALQHKEGWFFEYDGADLGYLSVTLDCLYDIYDCSQDRRILKSIKNCIKFCASILAANNFSLSSLNSRNTDYIVPYGFVRGLIEDDIMISKYSSDVLSVISKKDAFNYIDERYWSHYIGHSLIRATNLIKSNSFNNLTDTKNIKKPITFPGAGIYEIRLNEKFKAVISSLKGGVTNLIRENDDIIIDFGWTVEVNKIRYTSYWFSRDFKVTASTKTIIIQGYLYPVLEFESTPLKHFLLRLISFAFGQSIIKHLKSRMIFRETKNQIKFSRTISKNKDTLKILDCIKLENQKNFFSSEPKRETGFSFRHVASAGIFVPVTCLQDSDLLFSVNTKINKNFYEISTNIKMGKC